LLIVRLDPFFEYSEFERTSLELRKVLTNVSPFKIHLQQFCFFSKKKGSILWIKPRSDPPDALLNLQKTIMNVYPNCNEITKIGPNGFQPHMTLGKFTQKTIAQEKADILNKSNFKPIEFEVKEIYFFSRVGSSPYQVRTVIALGPNVTKMNYEPVLL